MTTPSTTALKEHTPRVALVTGGSGGIGSAVVQRLAADGFGVAVHYSGSPEKAEQVADTARAAGAEAILVGADVADEKAVAAMFDEVERRLGEVDVLVHSAGIMLLAPLAQLD